MNSRTSPLKTLGENAKKLRLANQWTQEVAAVKGGFSYKHYQSLETGKLGGVTYSTIERLSALFNVEVWQLFHPAAFPKPKIQKISPRKIRR